MAGVDGSVRFRISGFLTPHWRVLFNKLRSRWGLALLVCLGLEAFYVWVVSAGWITQWPNQGLYYSQLAEGFNAGHLFIPTRPLPQLIAQANPYDTANGALWVGGGDSSYYKGHFYLYFGPVPALLHLALSKILPKSLFNGDTDLTFVFCSVTMVAGVVLLDRIARRLLDKTPTWLLILGMLSFGLAFPTTVLLASGGTYQCAIAGGQAFLFLGIVAAFDAVFREPSRSIGFPLACAGAAWILALGCRVSLAAAVGPLVVATLWAIARRRGRSLWPGSGPVLSLGLPLLTGTGALLLYNYARFDHWLEFGQRLQLAWLPIRWSPDYVLTNLHAYFTRLPKLTCSFPYLDSTPAHGTGLFSRWIEDPPGYLLLEGTIGLFYLTPIVFASPAALLGLHQTQSSRAAYAWCLVMGLSLAVLAGMAPFGMYTTTYRYMADFTNGWILLGLLGIFYLGRRRLGVSARRGRFYRWLGTGLMTVTILAGLLLGHQGYGKHFAGRNPQLFAKLDRALSLCRANPNQARLDSAGLRASLRSR